MYCRIHYGHKRFVPVNLLPQRRISIIALQRPSSVGIRPVRCLIERLSVEGLLVYKSINLRAKNWLPVNWLELSQSVVIAVHRPSSVGMLPVQQGGLFKLWVHSNTIGQSERKSAYLSIGSSSARASSAQCRARAPSELGLCSKKVMFTLWYTRIPIGAL
jgi:hypothetical protein